MPETAQKKLEHFTGIITADALEQSRRIYESIREESEQALTGAENDALSDTYRYVKEQVTQIRAEAGRTISKKIMDNKRDIALRRGRMSGEVLELVRTRLADYVKTPEYKAQLRGLTARTLEIFGADTVIYLRPEDMPLAGELLPKTKVLVEFREGDFELGGLQASCRTKRRFIDESFDTTLAELAEHFAELMGTAGADVFSPQ